MENYVVSARKYRPDTFDAVVGQSHITDTLKNAIRSSQLAQAFLFCGPRGVGKTTCSRILAKTINCLNITPETEPCDECTSCKSFNSGNSLNISELDAASNNSVEDIRNLIEQVRYPPQAGKKKVYIIDEVHMLSNQAFNAFLKTLEEPPSYAIFILATTEKHKIIPTILSRCQIFDFNRIQPNDVARHLEKIAIKENVEAEEEALQLIGRKADGALRDALSIFDMLVTFSPDRKLTYVRAIDNLHVLDYDYYFKLTDAFLSRNHTEALLIFDEILKKGFDGHNFVVGLCEHLRDLLVSKDAATVSLLELSESIKEKYKSQAAASSFSFLMSALNLASACELGYKNSKNQRLHVEMTLLKLSHVMAALSIPQLVEDLKKKRLAKSQNPSEEQNSISKTTTSYQNPALAKNTEDIPWKKTPKVTTNVKIQKKVVVESKVEEKKVVNSQADRNSSFDTAKAQKVWKEFFKSSPSAFAGSLINAKLVVEKSPIIKVELLNNIALRSEFSTIRIALNPHLANNLDNDFVQIEIIDQHIEKQIPVKALSEQEKLDVLVKEFPLINEAMRRFGLQLDN